ncbi:hypothetical protein B9Z19DRAFT_1086620 [Tuber borchii]|uniref:Uncharacterized protein n=1 Tax=Tuber borchii TaxID=42251 RepID=A0A2T6ZP25_TUBBO|nr:hypothetical protein B9Z19DRAFT_1086620 [Tuber borchii]
MSKNARTATVPEDLQHRAVLKGVLQTKDYIFTKWALVTNDIGNTPGKKGATIHGGWGIRCR